MTHEFVLRGGLIADGSGAEPVRGDLAITGERISAIADAGTLSGKTVIDADGLIVAPGFINMLSWANISLLVDGHSQSDIRQGVTLEVLGEGSSMGPLNDVMKADAQRSIFATADMRYDIAWTTLAEYLAHLVERGVSTNVASFVGHGTLREYVMGYQDRLPTPDELAQMQQLLHQAMRGGAVGMSSALIYPPMVFSDTAELIALAKVVAQYDGLYITHMRSEGSAIFEALDEFLTIVRDAGVRGEIYHLKAAGRSNWDKMPQVIERINAARDAGLPVTADMYTYPASGTGLDSCLPPWAHEGGHDAMIARLKDPVTREHIKAEMKRPAESWENMYHENTPDRILLAGFQNPALKHLTGKRLDEIMALRGSESARDTVIDLIIEDDSRIFTIYFSMTEDNLRQQVQQPWMSFCSDAGSIKPEPPFTGYHPHPRAYGSFARVLGKYVRNEKLIPVGEAVRRLAALPADTLKIDGRGRLQIGNYADVVAFDLDKVQDHATYDDPHHFSEGMIHVFVNGGHVLRDGDHTGATPGQVVHGPGYRP